MTIQGYMIDVDYDGQVLRVHGRNKAARVALAGADHDSDVAVPKAAIADVALKDASMMGNGNLRVTTVDGAKYQLHFRRKHAEDFRVLAELLRG